MLPGIDIHPGINSCICWKDFWKKCFWEPTTILDFFAFLLILFLRWKASHWWLKVSFLQHIPPLVFPPLLWTHTFFWEKTVFAPIFFWTSRVSKQYQVSSTFLLPCFGYLQFQGTKWTKDLFLGCKHGLQNIFSVAWTEFIYWRIQNNY